MADSLTTPQIQNIESHLRSRGVDPDKTHVIMDVSNNIATFLLYNLSGQLVGYQRYNPSGNKTDHTNSLFAKYYTYITKESPATSKLAVWGLEYIDTKIPHVFITEGIFDAIKIKNAGHPVLAVLSNNPVHLRQWMVMLNKKIIVIKDNDAAGSKLEKYGDYVITVPSPYKDLGDMPQGEVNSLLDAHGFTTAIETPISKQSSIETTALEYLRSLINGSPYENQVYLAGGAVRDELMGKPIKDIDIVITQPDGGIQFSTWLTKKLGIYRPDSNPVVFPKFGTAKFNLRGITFNGVDLSGIDIEAVMTRGESYTAGSRKPMVDFADLKTDAERRDLTVNSLYKNISTGETLDVLGTGIQDIQQGIVRTPLDPDITFSDDPLRMLRAVRFAVKYNWKMDSALVGALKRNAHQLTTISKERIQDELNKILVTDRPDMGLRILSSAGLMQHIIPELDNCKHITQNKYHKDDVFDHILEVVKNSPPILEVRLAALFHDIAKPLTRTEDATGVHFYTHEDVSKTMAEDIMKRLRYSSTVIQQVCTAVGAHMRLKPAGDDATGVSDKSIRKFKADVGDALDITLHLMHADNSSHSEVGSMPNQIPNMRARIDQLATADAAKSAKPILPINGHDIIKTFNVKPGPLIKTILAAVEDMWYDNPEMTRDDAMRVAQDTILAQQSDSPSVLNTYVRNPDTGNDILVKTALQYSSDKAVHKIAKQKIYGK